MDIEIFRVDNPPHAQQYSEALTAGIVRGNMGSLVVLKLGPGLELAEHSHEQEHVGVVVSGEFFFFDGQDEVRLRTGDLYRVAAQQRHGVRCARAAVVVQARIDGVMIDMSSA